MIQNETKPLQAIRLYRSLYQRSAPILIRFSLSFH